MATRTPARTAHRLIYVEDDVVSICLVQQVVASRKQLALVTAADVGAALKLARREAPELILVNVDLGAVGAAGLLKILRANPAAQSCPILALGIDAAPEAAVRALEAGYFLYLVKPLQAPSFGDALDYALEFSALERAEL